MITIDPKTEKGLVCHGCSRLIAFANWLVSEMDACPSCGQEFNLKILIEEEKK